MTPQIGKLVEWHDARGYGFIQPSQPGATRVFLHIHDYRTQGRRPELGEILRYRCERQPDGRPKAVVAERVVTRNHRQLRSDAEHARHRTAVTTWLPPLLLLGFAALLVWAKLQDRLLALFWPGLLTLNLITLVAYWRDKRAATRGAWRTPESSLHLLELMGGWPAAWLAQLLLRHKSRKASFRATFLAASLANFAIVAWWATGFPLP